MLAYQLMPLDPLENMVFLKVAERATQPGLWVLAQQQSDESVDGRVLHMFRKLEGIFQYLLVNLQRVFGLLPIRDISGHELEEHNAKGPQIGGERVALAGQGLGRHVVGCSNHGESLLISVQFLAGAEVDQFEVPVPADHHVLRLEVAVYEGLLVHALDDVDQLGGVEDGLFGVEEADEADGVEELDAVDELSEEVDVVLVFVGPHELHHKGGGEQREGLALVDEVLLQLGLDGLLLGDRLECEELGAALVAHQKDVAELPLAQLLHHLEIGKAQFLTHLRQAQLIVFLCLKRLADGLAVPEGLVQAAPQGLDYLLQSSPRDLSLLLHLDLTAKSSTVLHEGTVTVKFGPSVAVRDHVLSLGNEEDELAAEVLLASHHLARLHVFELEAVNYLLQVLLTEPLQQLR